MSSALPDLDAAVVGAGFSGIGTAIKLDRAQLGDYLVIEPGDGVGGTWHWNLAAMTPCSTCRCRRWRVGRCEVPVAG